MATHSSNLVWRIPKDRGVWRGTVHGVTESDLTEQLSTHTHMYVYIHTYIHMHTYYACVCAKTFQSCPTLCDPMDCSPPDSSVLGDSPGKITGVGCHALLQGTFPTQELNSGLLHCRQILYQLREAHIHTYNGILLSH